ncbi:hypothetical protein PVAP13_5NG454340 [Panicum virgatum]|uniref:Uncharacterized protein n=1 Tax=Panicum virgatum TaxID=38727 RepID=A0A8T0S2B6_PANVG|nr:hypothetical protein PVAP13_5NG454340 [Panicum virgatum]
MLPLSRSQPLKLRHQDCQRQVEPVLKIVGRHPNLLFFHDPLLMEVGLTSVDEDELIGFPIVAGKSIFWNRGGRSLWCSPEPCLLLDDDERSAVRTAIAWALESTVTCRSLTALTRVSTVVFRSAFSPELSPMVTAGDGGAAVACGGCVAAVAGGGELAREGEDRRDRDTRLSRASNPWVAGPRLRSS